MKVFIIWIFGILGFFIGVVGLFDVALRNGMDGVSCNCEFFGWFSYVTLILTPLSFVKLTDYKNVSINTTSLLLKIACLFDVTLLASYLIRKDDISLNRVGLISYVVYFGIWQITVLITYILQVRAQRKS